MTQAQLDSAVAEATGEPLRLIRDLGFSLVSPGPDDRDPEEPGVGVACPTCGRIVPDPGTSGDSTPMMAECLDCDVYFDVAPDEVYAACPTRP